MSNFKSSESTSTSPSTSPSTPTATASKPVATGLVFADPVAYLASLGVEASLVTGTTLRVAA